MRYAVVSCNFPAGFWQRKKERGIEWSQWKGYSTTASKQKSSLHTILLHQSIGKHSLTSDGVRIALLFASLKPWFFQVSSAVHSNYVETDATKPGRDTTRWLIYLLWRTYRKFGQWQNFIAGHMSRFQHRPLSREQSKTEACEHMDHYNAEVGEIGQICPFQITKNSLAHDNCSNITASQNGQCYAISQQVSNQCYTDWTE